MALEAILQSSRSFCTTYGTLFKWIVSVAEAGGEKVNKHGTTEKRIVIILHTSSCFPFLS